MDDSNAESENPRTVADYIQQLSQFPADWPVHVMTPAGGGIMIEHREINGNPAVGIYGRNGGKIGESPLTEEEYQKQSTLFLSMLNGSLYRYTTIHGDHRMYIPGGQNDTCYGIHFDRRVIERLVAEGHIAADTVEIERVRRCDPLR